MAETKVTINGETNAGGAWTTFNPTTTGFAATPTTTGTKYTRIGNTIIYNFKVAGTSNGTTTLIALPFTAATGTDTEGVLGLVRDNGAYKTVAGRMIIDLSNYNVVTCFTDMSSGTWTASGAKEVRGTIIYEAA